MKVKDALFRVQVFLRDTDKKPALTMLREFLGLWVNKKNFPIHYIGRLLYRNDFKNPYAYMDMKQYRSIVFSKSNNQEAYGNILNNKLFFALFCEKNDLPTPSIVGYNLKGSFFYEGNVRKLDSPEEVTEYFEHIFKTKLTQRLFIKSFSGKSGREVFLLETKTLSERIRNIASILLNGNFIHQEGVEQHPEINKIYEKSVNTLRVETFIDSLGRPHILGTVMRFGTGGKVIDNVGSGGFFVPVDQNTGELMAKGIRAMIFGGNQFSNHPDTNFVFKGFKVPYFKEALEMSTQFASCIPNKLAGWDIAITPEGPTMLEGNQFPGITMGEMAYGGYVNHPLFQQMISSTL